MVWWCNTRYCKTDHHKLSLYMYIFVMHITKIFLKNSFLFYLFNTIFTLIVRPSGQADGPQGADRSYTPVLCITSIDTQEWNMRQKSIQCPTKYRCCVSILCCNRLVSRIKEAYLYSNLYYQLQWNRKYFIISFLFSVHCNLLCDLINSDYFAFCRFKII